jgi:hypothetical protein
MDQTPKRTAMSAADLFVLLDREYRRRRLRECGDCFVQLPFRVDEPVNGNANWELVIPQCKQACESILQELVNEYQGRYVLASPN